MRVSSPLIRRKAASHLMLTQNFSIADRWHFFHTRVQWSECGIDFPFEPRACVCVCVCETSRLFTRHEHQFRFSRLSLRSCFPPMDRKIWREDIFPAFSEFYFLAKHTHTHTHTHNIEKLSLYPVSPMMFSFDVSFGLVYWCSCEPSFGTRRIGS